MISFIIEQKVVSILDTSITDLSVFYFNFNVNTMI